MHMSVHMYMSDNAHGSSGPTAAQFGPHVAHMYCMCMYTAQCGLHVAHMCACCACGMHMRKGMDVCSTFARMCARRPPRPPRQWPSQVLVQKNIHLKELVQEWDRKQKGEVNKIEFRQGVRSLGVRAEDNKEVDELFASLDEDGGGTLQRRQSFPAPPELPDPKPQTPNPKPQTQAEAPSTRLSFVQLSRCCRTRRGSPPRTRRSGRIVSSVESH